MGLDEDFHQLAVDYPEALLALLGAPDPGGPYRGLSPELKASTRRIDVVLEPEAHQGPSYVVELYGYRNDDALRNLLEKHVGYCRQTGRWGRVEAALLFTEPKHAEGLLPVNVDLDTRLYFQPLLLTLPEVAPEALLEQDLEAWVLLPLVGPTERVLKEAGEWFRGLRERAAATGDGNVVELFLRFLAARLGDTLDVSELLGDDVMEDTLTGRRLLAKGKAEGKAEGERGLVARLLQIRLGAAAAAYVDRLGSASQETVEALAERIADRKLDDDDLVAALERLLAD